MTIYDVLRMPGQPWAVGREGRERRKRVGLGTFVHTHRPLCTDLGTARPGQEGRKVDRKQAPERRDDNPQRGQEAGPEQRGRRKGEAKGKGGAGQRDFC